MEAGEAVSPETLSGVYVELEASGPCRSEAFQATVQESAVCRQEGEIEMGAREKLQSAARSLEEGSDATRSVGMWVRQLAAAEAADEGAFGQALCSREATQWAGFNRDVFGSLYGLGVEPAAEPAAGSEWISRVLEIAEALPEWQDLQARAEGDAWACGVAAAQAVHELGSTLDEVLGQLPEQDPAQAEEQAQEAEAQAQEAAEAAEAAEAGEGNDGSAGPLQEAAEAAQAAAVAARENANATLAQAQAAAKSLDGTTGEAAVRKALRRAEKATGETLDDMAQAMAGLGHGAGAGALSAVKAPSVQVQAALRADPRLRRIAALAGRMRLTAKKAQQSRVEPGREEAVDVEMGDDIQRLLPSELAQIADPDLEILVLRRLVERQALQYRLAGTEAAERGPIIVLVDSSGSMSGARSEWAMGVALALLEVAARQRRPFALAHFDDGVQAAWTVEKPRSLTLARLLEMVSFFSGGGTNVQTALDHAHALIIGRSHMRKADVILVSDGESGDFSDRVESLKKVGASTYGVAIATRWSAANAAGLEDYVQVSDSDVQAGADGALGKVFAL